MSDSIGTGPRCPHGIRGGCAVCEADRLRDALRPFAQIPFDDDEVDGNLTETFVQVGHIRQARELLDG